MCILGSILILAFLIFLNGIFAASELAIVSLNKNKVKLNAENGNKQAKVILQAVKEPSKFLATIQIGISLISLFSGAFAADVFSVPLVNLLVKIGVSLPLETLKPATFFAITLVLSYFILIFGELVPKRLGMHYCEQIAYISVSALNVLSKIVSPFVKLLSVSTDFVLKMFGIHKFHMGTDVTEDEIRMMVDSGGEYGSIAESEQEMINNIFEFDNKTAEDACIHRMDVVALANDAEYDEIIEALTDQKYSRIPVYGESIDDILGILHIKDIMQYMFDNKTLEGIKLEKLLRAPYFVPFSKRADELFQEMQQKRVHMAIVVDEYGGTLGVVTMEDLVEEIMGKIFDEHDEVEQPDITKIDDETFQINGITDLEAVSDFFDVALPIDDYDTLSGFLISKFGHIPGKDECPELEFNGLLFKVLDVSEKRISSIIVKIMKVEA